MKIVYLVIISVLLSCKKEKVSDSKIDYKSKSKIETIFSFPDTIRVNEMDYPIFNIETIDTLKNNELNKKQIKYSNKDYDGFDKRYIEVLYVISDTKYDGDMKSLENFTYGGLKDVKSIDTLEIRTFNEKGNKIITF